MEPNSLTTKTPKKLIIVLGSIDRSRLGRFAALLLDTRKKFELELELGLYSKYISR